MNHRVRLWSPNCCVLMALGQLALVGHAAAQEWTRFRGPNGTGVSEATTVPAEWTEDDYNWKVELPGIGHSSPVAWGDKIFLSSAFEDTGQRIVLCTSAADGSVVWERRFDSTVHPKHARNSFASSTPAVDEKHVYVVWSTPEEYTLRAFDHDGRDAWQLDLGPFAGEHSCGTSPIVYQDRVILGGDQGRSNGPNDDVRSFLIAVDRLTGKTCWRTDRRTKHAAYSTPCVYQTEGQPAELIFNSGAHGISGIDPQTGATNWELAVFDKRSVSSPVVAAGLVFGTCGSGGGGNYVAAVRPGSAGRAGSGSPAELVYRIDESAPYVPTLVARGDLVFLWGDKGVASCVRAATGQLVWRERVGGNYSGSPVWVGGRLYSIDDDGVVVVLAASEKFELVARNPLGEESRSTPAVAGGRMYLRTYSHLFSVGGRK